MGMYCDQCEQTAKGTACTVSGACGKNVDVAALQDLLIHAVKGLSLYAAEARRRGIVDAETNRFTLPAIFATVTNVDFDPERFKPLIDRAVELRERLKAKVAGAGTAVNFQDPSAGFQPDLAGLIDRVGRRVRSWTAPRVRTSSPCSASWFTASKGWRPTPSTR